jgi:hypothetical protein
MLHDLLGAPSFEICEGAFESVTHVRGEIGDGYLSLFQEPSDGSNSAGDTCLFPIKKSLSGNAGLGNDFPPCQKLTTLS